MAKSKGKGNKKNCNNPFLKKSERKKLFNLLSNVDWCDEDSVFDVGVELGRYSVKLRSSVLERNE